MTTGTSRIVASIIVILLLALGAFLYYTKYSGISGITSFTECKEAGYQVLESYPEQCRTPDGRTFVNENATSTTSGATTTQTGGTSSSNPVHPNIHVTNVSANQIITSPTTIEGEARGWYFEGSFPVELVDGNGTRLALVPAQAKSDWMSANFVPFSVTLTFSKPTTATGTLIFRNDNPSGLPQNQQEYRLPVRFSTTERTVKLYYYNPSLDKDAYGTTLCSSKGLVAVDRTIPVTQTPLKDVLTLLLRGELTANEKASGITTEFPLPSVTLTNATISSSGVATVTLTDPLERTSGGACRAQVLRTQVDATARQFSNVKSVSFSPSTLFQP